MGSLIRWADVDQMQGSLQEAGLALQVLQLEGGNLGGDALFCRVGPLSLLRLRMERSLHSWGPKPPGQLTVTLDLEPLPRQASVRAHGRRFPPPACSASTRGGRCTSPCRRAPSWG
jgi:hypothetical protein